MNYLATSRTNYFHVTDEDAYQKLFANLRCGDDNIVDFTETDKDGRLLHGFGARGNIDYLPIPEDAGEDFDECEIDFDIGVFLEGIQQILPEDEVFVLQEAGAEGLRYVSGYSTIVTRDSIQTIDLYRATVAAVKEHFEAKGITPQPLQMDY